MYNKDTAYVCKSTYICDDCVCADLDTNICIKDGECEFQGEELDLETLAPIGGEEDDDEDDDDDI